MNAQSQSPVAQATGGQIARGAAWMMGFKFADKSIGLVSTLILARLLTPADFGLVAIAMAVVAFTELMSAFGFDTALIQRQDAKPEHYHTAWTFNVLFGLGIAAVLAAIAVPVGLFYGDPRLTPVLMVLAASALVNGFGNIGVVAFRKELDFRREFGFLFAKRLAGFVVTVAAALLLKSYWALIAGVFTARAMSVWMSYRLHPFRPHLSLAARHDLMHFSRWLFLSNLIGFASTRSTDFILGRTVGSHDLGVYRVSYDIASMPSTELIAPLNRAVYPAYARLALHPEALHKRVVSVVGIICLIGIPACAALFVAADAAVRVVLGPKWLEVIPLMRLFVVCGLMSALQNNLYLVIVALGKPKANTVLSACVTALALPLIIFGSLHYGVKGAAYAMLLQSVLGLAGILFIFQRHVHMSPLRLLPVFWRPAVAAAVMGAAMLSLDGSLHTASSDGFGHLVRLLSISAVGVATYATAVWLLWKLMGSPQGAEATVWSALRDRVQALRLRLRHLRLPVHSPVE